jgi:hypothetical protein
MKRREKREERESRLPAAEKQLNRVALKRRVAGSKQRRIAPHGLGWDVREARGVGLVRRKKGCG